jgi:RNA polymerase sigma factor (sigma-70 family)
MYATRTHITQSASNVVAIPAGERSKCDDAQLAHRVGAGDTTAFALLDARHRGPLIRYAGALMRRSEHDAEDVVQDVLVRAHAALRAGNVPTDLRPWLYRLTRNRAFDEMRRKRWADAELDPGRGYGDADRQDPERRLLDRETLWQLKGDILALPARQRQALLARELEGASFEEIATRLDVTVAAARKLALRARENLVRARTAREADCDVIRASLLGAEQRGARPTEHALRHVKGCDDCRTFRSRKARPAAAAVAVLRPGTAGSDAGAVAA